MRKLFVIVLLCFVVYVHAQEHPMFQKGLDYFNVANYKSAIASFENYLNTVNSSNTSALYNVGLSFYRLKNYDSAIYYYKKALVSNPDYLMANLQLGVTYDVTGSHYDDAVYYINKAIQLDPQRDNSYYEMGVTHFYAKKYSAAIEVLRKAVNLNNANSKYYNLLAKSYDESGMTDSAFANYQKTISFDSKQIQPLRRMGDMMVKRKDFNGAKEYFARAYEINRLDPDVLLGYGNAYFNNGEYEASIQYYKDATIADSKWITAYEYLGDALRMTKKYDEAIDAYTSVYKLNPKNVNAIYYLGLINVTNNNIEEAKKYQKILAPLDATKAEKLAGYIK